MEPGRSISVGNLHAIRGIAALIVVFFHAKFLLWVGGREFIKAFPLKNALDYGLFSLDMLTSCGTQCVVVFFLLSAFVIKYSFHKEKLSIPLFYKIRATRIYLPYFISLLVSALVLYLILTYFDPTSFPGLHREFNQRLNLAFGDLGIRSFLKALLFLPGNGEYFGFNPVYWSLLQEVIFYLLFPIYDRLKPKVLIGLVCLFAVAYYFTGSKIFYYQIFFLLGLLIFDIFVTREKRVAVRSLIFWLVLFILFVTLNVSLKVVPGVLPDCIAVLLYFWVVNFLLHATRVIRPLGWLGDFSYTLYLFHIPVLILSFAFLSRWDPDLSLYSRIYYYSASLLCVVVAYPIYLLVERRSLSLVKLIKRNHGIY